MRLVATVSVALALSACATTDTDTDTAQQANVTTNENGEEVRCERVSGSRLPGQRVCRTEAEWEFARESGQDLVREVQRQPQHSPN